MIEEKISRVLSLGLAYFVMIADANLSIAGDDTLAEGRESQLARRECGFVFTCLVCSKAIKAFSWSFFLISETLQY